MRPPFEDVRQASMSRVNAENALRRLTDHPHDGGMGLPVEARQVIEAAKTLEKAIDEYRRVQDRQATRSAEWQASSRVLSACEAWLRDGRPSGTVLEDFDGPSPKLNKGETVLDAVERLRRRGRELKADLHRIEGAPYPSSHAKAKCRAEIEALAARGAPDVTNLIEHDGKIEWPIRKRSRRASRVTVSCATEIIKLNLDSEDTKELMTLPQPDIPRNVERLKKEAKRKEAFERMTPEELEALADAETPDADNHAVIAAVAKCQKVMRDLKPRFILCVALELKDWGESLGANQPDSERRKEAQA
jgi:hypothetical protein